MTISPASNVKSKRTKLPPKPKTAFERAVWQYQGLLVGDTNILFIDPSSGSRQSMPGYCYVKNGKVQDAGTIEVRAGMELNKRLHRIVTSLRQDFPKVDLLVTEFIPAFIMNQGYTSSIVNLHRGVGAILGGVECEAHIEVPAQTWHKFAPEGYQKSDAKDAVMLAIACWKTLDILRGAEVESSVLEGLYGALRRLDENKQTSR